MSLEYVSEARYASSTDRILLSPLFFFFFFLSLLPFLSFLSDACYSFFFKIDIMLKHSFSLVLKAPSQAPPSGSKCQRTTCRAKRRSRRDSSSRRLVSWQSVKRRRRRWSRRWSRRNRLTRKTQILFLSLFHDNSPQWTFSSLLGEKQNKIDDDGPIAISHTRMWIIIPGSFISFFFYQKKKKMKGTLVLQRTFYHHQLVS